MTLKDRLITLCFGHLLTNRYTQLNSVLICGCFLPLSCLPAPTTLEAAGTSCYLAPSSSRSPCSCPEAGRIISHFGSGHHLKGSILALACRGRPLFKACLETVTKGKIKKLILDWHEIAKFDCPLCFLSGLSRGVNSSDSFYQN